MILYIHGDGLRDLVAIAREDMPNNRHRYGVCFRLKSGDFITCGDMSSGITEVMFLVPEKDFGGPGFLMNLFDEASHALSVHAPEIARGE